VKDGIPHHGVYPLVLISIRVATRQNASRGHQGMRRYIRLFRDKVAEPIFRTCIGAARRTLGRQVLEAYFLVPMERDGFSNKLKPCNLFLDIVALAPLPEHLVLRVCLWWNDG
jgi:hypothetical protein